MINKTIELKPDYSAAGVTHSNVTAKMVTYIYDHADFREGALRPMILICPGGGYAYQSDREAEPIALKMNSLGYNACVLYYSLGPEDRHPSPLIDAAAAIAYIRSHASEWDTDPTKICIAGFSAGGHVAASLGIMWKHEAIIKALGGVSTDYKPDCMLLAYPVITSGDYAHKGSFENLIGEENEANKALYEEVSLENHVDKDTVRTFLWHTYEDGSVPVENSLMLLNALRKNKIPCEFHMFEHGGHGLALGTKETAMPGHHEPWYTCSRWPELFAAWF